MILFTQDGCPHCAELAARLAKAGVELGAVPGLTVYDYGTVDGAAKADEYDVFALPTLLEWRDERNWQCTSDVATIVGILQGEGDED